MNWDGGPIPPIRGESLSVYDLLSTRGLRDSALTFPDDLLSEQLELPDY